MVRCSPFAALLAALLVGLTHGAARAQRIVCGINLSELPGSIGGITPGQNQNRNTINVVGPYYIEASTIRFNPGEGIVGPQGAWQSPYLNSDWHRIWVDASPSWSWSEVI